MDWSALFAELHTPLSVVMLILFCGIVAWTFAPKRRAQMDEQARIPLRDDN
jgi:cbb3-type cytochrome oxidase subunit 3